MIEVRRFDIQKVTDSFVLPAGRWRGLFFHASGTNGTQALTLANLGILKITKNGKLDVYADVQFLHEFAADRGRGVNKESTPSDAFNISFPFDFYIGDDDQTNGFLVTDNDIVTVELLMEPVINSLGANGTVVVSAIPGGEGQFYFPQMFQMTIPLTAGMRREEVLAQENVVAAYVQAGDVSRYEMIVDNETVVNALKEEIESENAYRYQTDTQYTTPNWIECRASGGRHWSAFMNDSVRLALHGADNIGGQILKKVHIQALYFSPDEFTKSRADSAQKLQQKLSRKALTGKARALQAAEIGQ